MPLVAGTIGKPYLPHIHSRFGGEVVVIPISGYNHHLFIKSGYSVVIAIQHHTLCMIYYYF